MKKILYFALAACALVTASCNKEKIDTVSPLFISVQLTVDDAPLAVENVPVILASGGSEFKSATDSSGIAQFTVAVGVYDASVSFKQSVDGALYNYNGNKTITASKDGETSFTLPITASKSSQLILKEVYNGGCMDNENSKNYQYDKYIIVYNNSDTEVDASTLGFAMGAVSNTSSNNKYAGENGKQTYEIEGWTPASYSIWWFQKGVEVKIAPYSQIVIAINGAIDHTVTYKNSVDLSNADFCLYDPESGFNLASNYPAPSANVPATHYMKTYVFGMGTAWAFPMLTAAPFLIMPGSNDLEAFVKDAKNFDNKGTNNSSNYAKIPTEWVVDALDIWSAADETKFYSRFPSTVNVGYKVLTNKLGYTIYRNVDKEATEAIAENAGKLVYNYAGAVNADDTDPSGIDAEASIAAGCKIIYMDTNNSSKDFHLRKVASLKK